MNFLERIFGKKKTLISAASEGDLVEIERLLATKADVNAKDSIQNDGWTPLMWASYRGHLKVVQALLAAGADVNATGAFLFCDSL